MYSVAIHCVHNNGSEPLLHDLSSFSVCLSLAQTHAIFFSPLLILLVYTLCVIVWASVLHFFTCVSCVGHILCVVDQRYVTDIYNGKETCLTVSYCSMLDILSWQ